MVMLGVAEVNLVTVEAETLSTMWEVPGKSAVPLVARFRGAREHFRGLVMDHLASTAVPRMSSLPVFCKLSHTIREELGTLCTQHVYFPGQAIAEEGQSGSGCMHVMNAGRAEVTKKGVNIKTCLPGSFFGSAVMLRVGEGVYAGTLTARSTCHVLSLSADAFQQALARQHPPEAGEQQLRAQAKRREHDLLRAAQMLVWRVTSMASGDVVTSCAKEASFSTIARQAAREAMFRQLFGAWRAHAGGCASARAQAAARRAEVDRSIERWRRDRDAAVWKAELQRSRRRGELAAGCLSARATARGGFGAPPQRPGGRPLLQWSPAATAATARGWRPGPRPEEAGAAAAAWAPKAPSPQADAGGLLQAWPAPRPSPHYTLRLPGMLTRLEEMPLMLAAAQAQQRPSKGEPGALSADQLSPRGSAQQSPSAPLPPLRPPGPGAAARTPTSAREWRAGQPAAGR
ncbi:unnamed protein product [Prorocentrum cordatum]|uniref:Cyclic nucleotide-binding domain-containing protein n=1 Tax=Prorocentrum cordatum TaxID=2364126 RepID=A0ABN9UDN2_9DINO|nr:unnamed protein product [Polarella glacialis]